MAECINLTQDKRKECNLLLFGPTGVGKSTFINALYNYLSYKSLDDANKSKVKVVVPSNFTFVDKNMKKTRIKLCSDGNEIMKSEGHSSTRTCKVQCLDWDNCILQIIDSPGIGDTQDIENDMTNFRHMCTCISDLGPLHAICLFLKPNESRLSKKLQYFIKELLSQLQMHRNARIVFVFTNSKSTFNLPGATLKPLITLLGKIKNSHPDLDIPFTGNNVFYLDNEDFRFLVALQNNIAFDSIYYQMCQLGWTRSRQECIRLLDYVVSDVEQDGHTPYNATGSTSTLNAERPVTSSPQSLSHVIQNSLRCTPELDQPNMKVTNRKEMMTASHFLKKETTGRLNWRETPNLRTKPSQDFVNHQITESQKEHIRNTAYSNVMNEHQIQYQAVKPMDLTQPTPMDRGPYNSKNISQSALFSSQNFHGNSGKEYNILLLGTTGVGKSTFINAYANYLSFKIMDEAVKNNLKGLIQTQFSIPDENYQQKHVRFGFDHNEDMDDIKGQSATQSCKAYEFTKDGLLLRIVDTPGIGDTRGIDQDRQNVQGILDFLSNYADLYAICILLKPNEARLTPLFSFCIKQLLMQSLTRKCE